jgi:Protein of unknown function (DUF3551)
MHRVILAVLAVLAVGSISVAGSGSAKASYLHPSSYVYPYCIQSQIDGSDCSYPSYGACMAAASGRGVECIVNPIVAFAQQYPEPYPQPSRQRRAHRSYN